jgi:hypothetical protein
MNTQDHRRQREELDRQTLDDCVRDRGVTFHGGDISFQEPVLVARFEYELPANRLTAYGESGQVVALAQPFVVPDTRDTPRAHVSPPQWVPYTTELTQFVMNRSPSRRFAVALGDSRGDHVMYGPADVPISEFIDRFNATAKAEGWGVYTSAQEPQPALSEYIHPAHCEPEEDEEPPSEWRTVALFLAMALIALIGVALVYGTARASSLGPELVANGSFDDGSAWTLGHEWYIAGGVAYRGSGTSAPIQQPTTSVVAGSTYLARYTVLGSSGVPLHRFRLQYGSAYLTCPAMSGDGVYSCTFIAPAGASHFVVQTSGGFSGIVDNVSVREVVP